MDFALCYLSDLLSAYCSVLLSLFFSSLQEQVSPLYAFPFPNLFSFCSFLALAGAFMCMVTAK